MIRCVSALLAALSALLAATPAMSGPVCEGLWRDAGRTRALPVRIRLPDGSAKVPLILFSHGLGGALDAGTAWAEAWVADGFAVIHLQHPGSDAAAVLSSGVHASFAPEQLRQRVLDVKFVLDTIPGKQREGECDLRLLDLGRIGMSGHSFGAHTAQALAGQHFPELGPVMPEKRIAASIGFSPTPPAGADDRQATSSMAAPFFSITGTQDRFPLASDRPASDRERAFAAMPPGRKYLLVIDGATHTAFAGNDVGSRQNATSAHLRETVIAASLNFWRAFLKDDDQALKALDSSTGVRETLKPGDRFLSR